jgi:hypothetical protein
MAVASWIASLIWDMFGLVGWVMMSVLKAVGRPASYAALVPSIGKSGPSEVPSRLACVSLGPGELRTRPTDFTV